MKKFCQYCDEQFDTKNKNQIYCSVVCREFATKEKIAERYRKTKVKSRFGKKRLCAGGCGMHLSAYNDEGFCNNCLISNKKLKEVLKEIKGYFDYEQVD